MRDETDFKQEVKTLTKCFEADMLEVYHQRKLNLLTIPIVSNSFVVEEAKVQIYKCKEVAYGKNTDASNVLEGDYGSWQDWTDVLVNFANRIKLLLSTI